MEKTADITANKKHPLSGQARFKMGVTGVLLPTLALLISSNGGVVATPHWQSGEIDQYVAILLSWPGYGSFLPLIGFSMLSLLIWLWRDKMIGYFVVRLGLYTGVILTIQFFALLIIAEPETLWMLTVSAAIFGVGQAGVIWIISYLICNARRFSIRYLLIVTTIVAIGIALIKAYGGGSNLIEGAFAIPLVGAIASPILSAITMTRAAIQATDRGKSQWAERSRLGLWEIILGWLGWVTCFVAAWKIAVEVMMVEYSKLPVTRPSCYVASAAAHGHPVLVRSHWVDGISMPVNPQLRRLKFLEIAIKVASPSLHCHARTMYDHFGPKLAVLCRRSRWFSDVAFLLLLLPETFAVTIRLLFRFRADQVNDLYR